LWFKEELEYCIIHEKGVKSSPGSLMADFRKGCLLSQL
ncbi:hypothetical protein T4A_12132, partial [Trichinella pseudospiralis]